MLLSDLRGLRLVRGTKLFQLACFLGVRVGRFYQTLITLREDGISSLVIAAESLSVARRFDRSDVF